MSDSNKLNLVLVVDSLAGGGAEKVVIELARAINEIGHNAILLSLTKNTTYDVPNDLAVYFLYEERKKALHRSWARKRHAQKLLTIFAEIEDRFGKINVIFSNLDYSHYVVSACNLPNVYYVVHNAVKQTLERSKKMGPLKWLRQKRLFSALDDKKLITVSDGLKDEVQSLSLFTPKHVTRIYNPFNILKIRRLAAQTNAAIPESPYIIHIGRFAKQKRHDVLFSALDHLPDEIKLVCLGANQQGIQRLAEKMGVAERIIIPGFQQNPYPWVKQAKCLVLSSDFEGLSMVLAEALICQTPVVSTDCPYGPSELLTGSLSDLLVPVGDADALAEKLKSVLNHPRKIAPDFLHHLDHRQIAQQYVNLSKMEID
ncbi:glycosyltransferase [Alteromonas sp. ASW11-130]|uniref:glycosyltransferase n=1 Tax=Alteromonas sp. ASW11-130 TaxID=3015775 RepID=UPI002242AB44|nr:glycosyltransferase [Alteromonas sp. ASW11-130]MCW8091186.1 glycosyltransferase [Alteromonas sp. ASW11-130]